MGACTLTGVYNHYSCFYPSISIEVLDAALDFASNYDNITDEEREIIMHACTPKHHVYTVRETIGVNGHHLVSLMLQWAASTVQNRVN